MGSLRESRAYIEEKLRNRFISSSLLRGHVGEMLFTVAEDMEDLEGVIITPSTSSASLDSTRFILRFTRGNFFEEDLTDPEMRKKLLNDTLPSDVESE